MTNHYHMIIETPEKNLSRIMHHINSSYTTYINIKRKRSGHLLQGRFKSIIVDKDSYLLELSRYLHLNPVRAGMARLPGDYPYSSYRSYTTEAGEKIVTTLTILNMISRTPDTAKEKYKTFVESALDEALESPMKNVYGGMILGSADFIKQVLGKIEIEQLESAETSHRRCLRASHLPEEVFSATCAHYGIAPEEIMNATRNDVRKKCIYLLKKHTSAGNREIGELLGGMGAAAVAKANQRFTEKLANDARLKKEMKDCEGKMSRVKV